MPKVYARPNRCEQGVHTGFARREGAERKTLHLRTRVETWPTPTLSPSPCAAFSSSSRRASVQDSFPGSSEWAAASSSCQPSWRSSAWTSAAPRPPPWPPSSSRPPSDQAPTPSTARSPGRAARSSSSARSSARKSACGSCAASRPPRCPGSSSASRSSSSSPNTSTSPRVRGPSR